MEYLRCRDQEFLSHQHVAIAPVVTPDFIASLSSHQSAARHEPVVSAVAATNLPPLPSASSVSSSVTSSSESESVLTIGPLTMRIRATPLQSHVSDIQAGPSIASVLSALDGDDSVASLASDALRPQSHDTTAATIYATAPSSSSVPRPFQSQLPLLHDNTADDSDDELKALEHMIKSSHFPSGVMPRAPSPLAPSSPAPIAFNVELSAEEQALVGHYRPNVVTSGASYCSDSDSAAEETKELQPTELSELKGNKTKKPKAKRKKKRPTAQPAATSAILPTPTPASTTETTSSKRRKRRKGRTVSNPPATVNS